MSIHHLHHRREGKYFGKRWVDGMRYEKGFL
jgi:hypothetical protein